MSSALDTERRLRALEQLVARLKAREYAPLTGTYTPTYVGGTTAGTTTYTIQVGEYVRVGGIVHAWGALAWSAATGTGVGRISLPFAARSTTNAQYPVAFRLNGIAHPSSDWVEALFQAGNSFFVLQGVVASTGVATSMPVNTTNAAISFSATYPVAT